MGKIFGITDLPVSKPFPSLEFGKIELIQTGGDALPEASKRIRPDTFIKETHENFIKSHLTKFFHRKHTKV